jgi:hypothetical protein
MEETSIEINTSTGENQLTTPKLMGFLDAVIIHTEKPVELAIESELGYTIFHARKIETNKYLAILSESVDKKYHKLNFAPVQYYLNERLIIKVIGVPNTQVVLLIRSHS